MASGLPVVTLDGGGNHELIEEASNGHILKTQDVELFAEKIRAVVQEANTFKRMSKSARTFAQQFDIRDYCKKLVHLYRTA
jgi:glycosyltransferase involved in cell wall biosynthesis